MDGIQINVSNFSVCTIFLVKVRRRVISGTRWYIYR